MMEYQDMMGVLGIFAEKILQNLVYGDSQTEEGKRMIEISLEVFDSFIYTSSSSKLFSKLSIITQLIQNHMVIYQYNIS